MNNKNDIESLLVQVNAINKSFDKISKIRGEKFNVFEILGLSTNEVRTHSAFIAELLNPNGTHEKGNVFIKEFCKILDYKKKEFNTKLFFDHDEIKRVDIEYWLGNKTETEGGYIDILVTGKNNQCIIIENKIYAGDQENQLLRYHNFSKSALLIYLTLDGHFPSSKSTNDDKGVLEKLTCISYEEDIIKWLENCKKYAVDLPILRESITQYILLIKKLTKQSMNEENKKEIVDLIMQKHLKEAEGVYDIWNDVKERIKSQLKNEIEKIADKLELKVYFKRTFCDKDSEFYFTKSEWCLSIYFYFETEDRLLYGVYSSDENKKCSENLESKIRIQLEDLMGKKGLYKNWIWVAYLDEWSETKWCDVLTSIPKLIEERINEVIRKLPVEDIIID